MNSNKTDSGLLSAIRSPAVSPGMGGDRSESLIATLSLLDYALNDQDTQSALRCSKLSRTAFMDSREEENYHLSQTEC